MNEVVIAMVWQVDCKKAYCLTLWYGPQSSNIFVKITRIHHKQIRMNSVHSQKSYLYT